MILINFSHAAFAAVALHAAAAAEEAKSILPPSLNFQVPKYSAVDILGLDSSITRSPSNLQQVAASIIDRDKKKGTAFSFSGAALGLGGGKKLNLSDYRRGGSLLQQERNSILSIALVQSELNDSTDLHLGVGLTVPIGRDQSDWRNDPEVTRDWSRLTTKADPLARFILPGTELVEPLGRGTETTAEDNRPIFEVVKVLNRADDYGKPGGAAMDAIFAAKLKNISTQGEVLYSLLMKHYPTLPALDYSSVYPSRKYPSPLPAMGALPEREPVPGIPYDQIVDGKNAIELYKQFQGDVAKLSDELVDTYYTKPLAAALKAFTKLENDKHWNGNKWDGSIAGRWVSHKNSFDKSLVTDGGAGWISHQGPLTKNGVWHLYGQRFWDLPFDVDGKGKTFVQTGGWAYGAGARFGNESKAWFVEGVDYRRDGRDGKKYNNTVWQGGYEMKYADSQWLQFSISNKALAKNNQMVFGINLAFDVSPKSGIAVKPTP